jgi:Ca2+-binding RTX toxin-like protein
MTISVDRVCRDPSFTNTAMVSSATPDSDLTNNQATQQTTIFAVVGTPGNDYLVGTQLDDLILGLDGNDMIFGLGGSDVICGGPGNDFIRAGAGDDTVFGGSGDDVIFGEAGDDTLFGNDGNDQIWGGLGNDAIYGDKGDDSLAGDLETFVNGRYSADPTDNRGGSDYINGGAGNDLIYGQGGDDCFRTAAFPQCPTTAFAGADHASRPELFGADGVDRINGGPGIDRLDGGAGDGNVLVGGPRPPVADFCSFGGTDVRDVTCVYPTPSGTAKVRWRTWQWPAA